MTESERIDALEIATGANTAAIAKLTEQQTKLTESTQGLVDVWHAGKTLQKVAKYLSSLAIVGIAFKWLWERLS